MLPAFGCVCVCHTRLPCSWRLIKALETTASELGIDNRCKTPHVCVLFRNAAGRVLRSRERVNCDATRSPRALGRAFSTTSLSAVRLKSSHIELPACVERWLCSGQRRRSPEMSARLGHPPSTNKSLTRALTHSPRARARRRPSAQVPFHF